MIKSSKLYIEVQTNTKIFSESKRNRTYDMCLKHDHIVHVDINQLCVMVSGKRQNKR